MILDELRAGAHLSSHQPIVVHRSQRGNASVALRGTVAAGLGGHIFCLPPATYDSMFVVK
jgi:hypothetical protein